MPRQKQVDPVEEDIPQGEKDRQRELANRKARESLAKSQPSIIAHRTQ